MQLDHTVEELSLLQLDGDLFTVEGVVQQLDTLARILRRKLSRPVLR